MAKNSNLAAARKAQNNEFYTQLADVEKELIYYTEQFCGKVVLCNCDDPAQSNFWRYFHLNFTQMGLRGLVSTHYDAEEPTYKLEYYGGDDANVEAGIRTELTGNGDFRSPECYDLLIQCNIVVTNPPFSLAREYIPLLVNSGKQFLIINNLNSVTYKEIFPFFRDNKMWVGYTSPKRFLCPDGTLKAFGNVLWFTNIDIEKRHEPLPLSRRFSDNPEMYPRFDNYDAINAKKAVDIPIDYPGVMGVPISFLTRYCPEQFEIVGITKTPIGSHLRTKIYDPQIQHRAAGCTKVTKLNDAAAILVPGVPEKYPFYEVDGRFYTTSYPRILVRRK